MDDRKDGSKEGRRKHLVVFDGIGRKEVRTEGGR